MRGKKALNGLWSGCVCIWRNFTCKEHRSRDWVATYREMCLARKIVFCPRRYEFKECPRHSAVVARYMQKKNDAQGH